MTLQSVAPTQRLDHMNLIEFPTDHTHQLVLERHSYPLEQEAPVTFAPSWPIFPMEYLSTDLERSFAVASWRRENLPTSMMNEAESLLVLPIGSDGFPMDNFTMSKLSWAAVFTMGRSLVGNDAVWFLADAGAYFLMDGDWDNIPRLEFNVATNSFEPNDPSFTNTARALNTGNWQFPGTARNLGFTHTLMPRTTIDFMRFWRPMDQFGDIRMGFEVPQGIYVTCNGHDPLPGDRAPHQSYNWRIISRPMPATPTESTSTSTPTTVDPSVAALSVAEEVTDVALELQRERDALEVKVASLQAKLETAKEACRTYTLRNDGCNAGKADFIEATGLWDEEIDSYNVIGVLQGMQRFEIAYTATVGGTYTTVAATEDDAREEFSNLTYHEIDNMVCEHIRETETPELTISYVELSDDQDDL